ncbi:MAG: hypothetical protein KDA53_15935 [Hyphomonas sp.]|nr:hypothetical protein [Hyphomonas sp.]
MTVQVISAGFGRTGTMSLKLALEQLGFGPCHHMEEVLAHGEVQVPLWTAAADGKADFGALYAGYGAAVDWPTAAFWKELAGAYPEAKFILSSRSVDSWVRSFSETIHAVISDRSKWPPPAVPWLLMVEKVLHRSLKGASDPEALAAIFEAHEAEVKAFFPPGKLLVHQAKDGWEPLCAYLGVPVPDTPYPRTNSKDEFFENIKAADDL